MSATQSPQAPVEIPEPTGVLVEPWSLGKIGRLAALFGPAAIVASVSIGAGETIVVVQAGSWAGYSLLWLIVASVLVKGVCVTYLLGRYTAASGELIGNRLVRLPGPRGWLPLAIIALELGAAGPLWAAIARPSGDLMYFLLQKALEMLGSPSADATAAFGFAAATWKSMFATAFVLAALVLGAGVSFASMERQQVIICCVLVIGTILGTLMVRPDFAAALVGCLSFGHVPSVPEWAPAAVKSQSLPLTMTTTFGYVGGSVMCYVAYANWIAIHRWGLCASPQIDAIRQRAAVGSPADYLPANPGDAARLRRLLLPLRWDVTLGAIVLFVVSASFMMAGAAAIYPRLQTGELAAAFENWSLLTDQAYIWQSIHPKLVGVYYVCVLAALWGTLQAYPQIYSRVTHEFLTAIWPQRNFKFNAVQLVICLYVLIVAVFLSWTDVKFTTLTNVVAFLATNGGVALAMLAALYLNFQLPPLYRTRTWMLVACTISAVVLVVVSSISGWELARSLLAAPP